MARNFRRTKFSRIGCWQRFHGSTIAKPRPYWVYANHTHMITRESAVMASEFSMRWCMDTIFMKISGMQPLARSNHVKESPISLDIAAPFPFANRLFSTLFTLALAKTMEDNSTFVDREPVGSGSLVACPRY